VYAFVVGGIDMRVRVKLNATIKNEAFYLARIEAGYHSLADFFKAFNEVYPCTYGNLIGIENMRLHPGIKTADALSKFLEVPIEELFPNESKNLITKIKKLNLKREIVTEAEKLISGIKCEEIDFIKNELREKIKVALSKIPPTQSSIIELYFLENKSINYISKERGLSITRIYQLISTGLRRLRHPNISASLKELI